MIKRSLLFLMLGWLVVATPMSALAHGGGTPRLTNAPAGPYRVYAWSDPEPWREGEVHLSLAVTLPAADAQAQPGAQLETPVVDAEIAVILTPVGGGDAIRLTATRQPFLNDFYFEADTLLPAAGLWTVAIEIDGPAGPGSSSFQVEALTPRTLNWTLLAAGIGILVLIAALAGLWPRRQDPNAAPRRPRRVTTRPA